MVPASASSVMKSYSVRATRRFPTVTRSVIVFLLGVLDGKNGFVFHFLQAFWFRLVVDVRLEELLRRPSAEAEP